MTYHNTVFLSLFFLPFLFLFLSFCLVCVCFLFQCPLIEVIEKGITRPPGERCYLAPGMWDARGGRTGVWGALVGLSRVWTKVTTCNCGQEEEV